MTEPRDDDPTEGGSAPAPRWHRYAVPALLLVHAAACWLARPIGYLTGQDDLEYVTLGQSLRDLGYAFLFRIDQPIHAQYPPGYPAMLAIWGAIGGDGFDWLALLSLLFSVGALLVTYLAALWVFGARVAVASLAVLAVNPALVDAGGNVASEAAFTFLSMLALVLIVRDDDNRRSAFLVGALAILAALTRTVGVLLIGAIGLHWLLQRRWKRVGILGIASLALVGSWMVWTFVAPEQHVGSSYVADLQAVVIRPSSAPGLLDRTVSRLVFYAVRAGPYTLAAPAIPGTPVDNAITTVLLACGLVIGTWLLLRRWKPAGLLLLAYAVLLIAWTWQAERFLVPLLPIVVPALLAASWLPLSRRRPGLGTAAMGAAVVLLLAGGVTRTAASVEERLGCRDWTGLPPSACILPDQASYFEVIRYANERIPRDEIFLAAKPAAVWYYAGHRSISYPASIELGPGEWIDFIRDNGARWIVLGRLGQSEGTRHLRQIEENCDRLVLERRFPGGTYLFRLADDDRPVADVQEGAGEACEAVREYRSDSAEQASG